MSDIVERLRERAGFARMESSVTAHADAMHFDDAAAEIDSLRAELKQARKQIEYWNADCRRLSGGLIALYQASDATLGALQSVAYDIALNCLDPETAKFQIKRRSALTTNSEAVS